MEERSTGSQSERRATDSRLYTMRGKIWLMVILLAVTNCVSGGIAFLAASLITSESWIPVLVTIAISTVTTIAFAWWISNDVLRPLDRLNLLAKSIERSPGMSVPRTTGAVETDDILHTISRASRQLTNVIDMMDDVSSGNTQAILSPLEFSDRLSESFQKLVAKVTDSIDAKTELNKLQNAVNQISSELSGLHRGDTVRIKTEFPATRTIADSLRYLIERNTETTRAVTSNALELRTLLNDGKSRVATAIDKDGTRDRLLKKLIAGIAESDSESQRSLKELNASLAPVVQVINELKKAPLSPEENAKSHSAVRRQFETALHKLRDVGEQSLAITHVAKSVQDLARRSNMIALNTSIHASGETTAGLSVLTQEIASLSERAEKANKAIAGISDSVVRDVNEANASIQWVTTEVAKIAARTTQAEETLARIAAALLPLADAPAQIDVAIAERKERVEKNIQVLEECAIRSEEIAAELKTCEANLEMLLEPVESLRETVATRKQTLSPITAASDKADQNGSGHPENVSVEKELLTVSSEK